MWAHGMLQRYGAAPSEGEAMANAETNYNQICTQNSRLATDITLKDASENVAVAFSRSDGSKVFALTNHSPSYPTHHP